MANLGLRIKPPFSASSEKGALSETPALSPSLLDPGSLSLASNQAPFLPGHVKILQILSSQIQEAFFLGLRSTAMGPSTENRQH